jgi:hypothetical protein
MERAATSVPIPSTTLTFLLFSRSDLSALHQQGIQPSGRVGCEIIEV